MSVWLRVVAPGGLRSLASEGPPSRPPSSSRTPRALRTCVSTHSHTEQKRGCPKVSREREVTGSAAGRPETTAGASLGRRHHGERPRAL